MNPVSVMATMAIQQFKSYNHKTVYFQSKEWQQSSQCTLTLFVCHHSSPAIVVLLKLLDYNGKASILSKLRGEEK